MASSFRVPRRQKDTRLVDLSTAPPIETLDLDNLQELSKELIRSYLVHYEVEPADTKPDMKKQLRRLVTGIRAGAIPKKPVTPFDATSFGGQPGAASTGASASGSGKPMGFATIAATQADIIQYFNALEPQTLVLARAFGIAPKIDAAAGIAAPATAPQNQQPPGMMEDEDAENVCVGCGKRANRECRYRRCKNCCVAAGVRCSVHARYVPMEARPLRASMTPEELEALERERKSSEAPSDQMIEEKMPEGTPPQSPGGPTETPDSSKTSISLQTIMEALEKADKLVIEADEADGYSCNVCNTVVESAVKRLKLNTEAMAEVWRHGDETDTLLGLFKTLKSSTVEDVQKWKDLMETTENDISVVENALRSLANTSESNEEFYATLHSLSQAKSINEIESICAGFRGRWGSTDTESVMPSLPLYQLTPIKRSPTDVHIAPENLTSL